jgi:hypothetical protein
MSSARSTNISFFVFGPGFPFVGLDKSLPY